MNCCPTETPAPRCSISLTPTHSVSLLTVEHHALLAPLPETSFGFCDVPTCDVVYVGADGMLIRKGQLRTRVGVKETEEPVPVCYCFDFTAGQIAADLHQHGRSTIRQYIQEQVRAGRCRCDMANPSGRCCLGNVGRVIATAALGEEVSR